MRNPRQFPSRPRRRRIARAHAQGDSLGQAIRAPWTRPGARPRTRPPSEGRVEGPGDAEDLVDLPGAAVDGNDEQVTGDPGRAGLAAAPHGQGLEALLGSYARRDDAASRRTRSVNRSS